MLYGVHGKNRCTKTQYRCSTRTTISSHSASQTGSNLSAGIDGLRLDIIPSNIHLAVTAESIIGRPHREKIIAHHLTQIKDAYDFILIDSPPNLVLLTMNAIYAADHFIIPTSYAKYSLDGIGDLFNTLSEVKEGERIAYKILRSMKDARTQRTNSAIEEALEQFSGPTLYNTIIRRTEALNQSQMEAKTIYQYDPKCACPQMNEGK